MNRKWRVSFSILFIALAYLTSVAYSQASNTESGFVTVKSATATLMSGTETIANVKHGERIPFTQRNGDWFLVEFKQDGKSKKGWIHKDDVAVEADKKEAVLPRSSPETWLKKVVVMTHYRPKLLKFNEATGKTETVGEVREADARVDKVEGDWLWIHTTNQEGWITRNDAVPQEEAIDYFTRRIEQNANDHFAYNARGIARKNKGEFELALADFTEAIRLKPDSAVVHNRGLLWNAEKIYAKAMADYDEAIRLDPQNYLAFCHRGELHSSLKETDKAIDDLTEAIRLLPGYAVGYADCGYAWLAKKDPDTAFGDFNDAIRFDPKLPIAYHGRGKVLYARKDYDSALADFDRALLLNPALSGAHGDRGWLWYDKKQYDKALVDLNEAIRLNPKDIGAIRGRGRTYQALKQYDSALADFGEHIRLSPKEAQAYIDRGYVWLDRNEFDHALADFNQAVEIDPQNAFAHRGRGRSYSLLKQRDRALEDFNEAIRLSPRWAMVHNDRGWLMSEMKEFNKAIEDYTETIRLDPHYTQAFINRAAARRIKREFDQSLADASEAVRLDPHNSNAYYQRATTYRAMKQYERAIADYDESVRINPDHSAGTLSSRGYTWFLNNNPEKALQDLEACEKLDPKNGWPHRHRAMLFATSSDDKYRDGTKASEELRRAQETLLPTDLYDVQAAVAAELGNFEDAVRWQEKLLENPLEQANPDMRQRLELYRQKRPYHEPTSTGTTG